MKPETIRLHAKRLGLVCRTMLVTPLDHPSYRPLVEERDRERAWLKRFSPGLTLMRKD
jgi:hypothetical protein